MIDELDLSVLEKWWLNSRGGRNGSDVFLDICGNKYIMMHDYRGEEKRVYLPNELQIKNEINFHG
jgi:hypothetical protein